MEPLERGLKELSCHLYEEKMKKVITLVDKWWFLKLEIHMYLNGSHSMSGLWREM
jgi:hypothetical protein